MNIRTAGQFCKKVWTRLIIEVRWLIHSDKKRVPKAKMEQYKNIFARAIKQTGKVPDIFEGDDYNNKVRWLMLFDQNPLIIQCSDKLAVREYVREAVGQACLNKIYATYKSADGIDFNQLPDSFVIKTNHDSGSVWLVKSKSEVDLDAIRAAVAKSLTRQSYGWEKGEWAYRHIPPMAFAEEYLAEAAGGVPDYKFHCAEGTVCFVHYIYDRLSSQKKDIILMPDGQPTDYRLDDDFVLGTDFSLPPEWKKMTEIAEKLSAKFKYVSVDLYVVRDGIRFGELTFYPRNGNKRGRDQALLGQLLKMDRTRGWPKMH